MVSVAQWSKAPRLWHWRSMVQIPPLTPVATVPELFFDKKQLIPTLQQILISHPKPPE